MNDIISPTTRAWAQAIDAIGPKMSLTTDKYSIVEAICTMSQEALSAALQSVPDSIQQDWIRASLIFTRIMPLAIQKNAPLANMQLFQGAIEKSLQFHRTHNFQSDSAAQPAEIHKSALQAALSHKDQRVLTWWAALDQHIQGYQTAKIFRTLGKLKTSIPLQADDLITSTADFLALFSPTNDREIRGTWDLLKKNCKQPLHPWLRVNPNSDKPTEILEGHRMALIGPFYDLLMALPTATNPQSMAMDIHALQNLLTTPNQPGYQYIHHHAMRLEFNKPEKNLALQWPELAIHNFQKDIFDYTRLKSIKNFVCAQEILEHYKVPSIIQDDWRFINQIYRNRKPHLIDALLSRNGNHGNHEEFFTFNNQRAKAIEVFSWVLSHPEIARTYDRVHLSQIPIEPLSILAACKWDGFHALDHGNLNILHALYCRHEDFFQNPLFLQTLISLHENHSHLQRAQNHAQQIPADIFNARLSVFKDATDCIKNAEKRRQAHELLARLTATNVHQLLKTETDQKPQKPARKTRI